MLVFLKMILIAIILVFVMSLPSIIHYAKVEYRFWHSNMDKMVMYDKGYYDVSDVWHHAYFIKLYRSENINYPASSERYYRDNVWARLGSTKPEGKYFRPEGCDAWQVFWVPNSDRGNIAPCLVDCYGISGLKKGEYHKPIALANWEDWNLEK